ncbi:hypothetical protein NDU88_005099 [Pleurodeles waltl]|uniref:Uncharacterized protein n=1 Tax=Pleurodeles waltl TaxID=8319 RepID=A0AAV7SKP3_PLEWA|nr:hypothetical protein NDU88_005099 [Pleurodeles waltl]
MHRTDHQVDMHCSLFSYEDADFLHLAWGCPGVVGFWSDIYTCLDEVAGQPVPLTPLVALIGCVEDIPTSTCRLRDMLLLLAKRKVAMPWGNQVCPKSKDCLVGMAFCQWRLEEYWVLMLEKIRLKDISAPFVAYAGRRMP